MTPRAIAMMSMFFGPVAAAADELTSYALTYDAARRGHNALLFVVTAVAAAIATTGLLLAVRVLRRKTEVFEPDRFVAMVAILVNAFFLAAVLVGYGMPKLLLHPTD